jgi:hypothetical protein
MTRLAHIIEQFQPDYQQRFGHTLSPQRAQALRAMQFCRTRLVAQYQTACSDCGEQRLVPHSCGHRLCPHCQHHESEQWIERQRRLLVPAEYFMLTFTLPSELRALAGREAQSVYAALMSSAWATLEQFCKQDRHLQGQAGALAVLHTHSRRLDLHPHVHVVMPAACVDERFRRWRTKTGYLFNHKALAKVFRAKVLAALNKLGLHLPVGIRTEWVVDCRSVGNGEKALVYLGRYLYRGVIREQDIVSCEHGMVCFRYQDSQTKQMRTRTLPGAEFLHLLLQHVLPKGFRRARSYGFLHPNAKRWIALLQWVLKVRIQPNRPMRPRPAWKCPCCGGLMRVLQRRLPPVRMTQARPKAQPERMM